MGQKKVLVTGASGLLGGRLCRDILQSANHTLVVGRRCGTSLAQLEISSEPQLNCEARDFDLTDKNSLNDICREIDIVVHLAASNAQLCERDPVLGFQSNVIGTRHLIDSAVLHSVEQFVFASTVHVYGETDKEVNEDSKCHPITNYSQFKRRAEESLEKSVRESDLTGIVLRLSNAIGHPVSKQVDCWHLITNDLVRQAICNGSFNLNSNSLVRRDFIPIRETCQVIMRFLEVSNRESFSVFNLSSGLSRPLHWLVDLISERLKHHERTRDRGVNLQWNESRRQYKNQKIFCNEKLLSHLKVDPFSTDGIVTEVDELIEKTYVWFGGETPNPRVSQWGNDDG